METTGCSLCDWQRSFCLISLNEEVKSTLINHGCIPFRCTWALCNPDSRPAIKVTLAYIRLQRALSLSVSSLAASLRLLHGEQSHQRFVQSELSKGWSEGGESDSEISEKQTAGAPFEGTGATSQTRYNLSCLVLRTVNQPLTKRPPLCSTGCISPALVSRNADWNRCINWLGWDDILDQFQSLWNHLHIRV